jgi:hypothetical protein
MRDLKAAAFALAALLAASVSGAQPAAPAGTPNLFELEVEGPADGMAIMGDHVRFISAGEGFETKLVKGAPYQAETVTETVQTLADGNRIVHRTTGLVARDGEGRTRREQTLGHLPGFAGKAGPRTIFIHDNTGGTSYALEPEERIARKMGRSPLFAKRVRGEGGPEGERHIVIERMERKVKARPAKEGEEGPHWKRLGKPESESLGNRVIEGVEATGTRTTITIPAGEIGNERAIEIVNERWVSSELQVVVMSRSSDPRFGETTYRLTGIARGEPDRSLFEVPSDYTVKEGGGLHEMRVIKRSPSKEKE